MTTKSKIFFLLVLLQKTVCYSQNRNNIWLLGISFIDSVWNCGIDFNSGQSATFSVQNGMPFFIANASICDTTGQLLFYTNGFRINNRNHDSLLNCAGFNPGSINGNYDPFIGSPVPQCCLFIPKPGSDSLYYLFHESSNYFTYNGQLQAQPFNFRYSIIDKTMDGGLGGIVQGYKSVIILNDTLVNGRVTACKHGNGRDWWIIVPRFWSNEYYKLFLTSDSLFIHDLQAIGNDNIWDAAGQACFSPDGSRYAVISYDNSVNLFRFDRCTGQFYDSVFFMVPNPTPGQVDNEPWGVAFSPNSRYLYIVLYSRILQYDTWSVNIPSTQIYVAEWDTFFAPFPTNFFMAQNAPDNKIYISTYNGNNLVHLIDQPDSLGLACNVIQNQFMLPFYNTSIPNHPNYDLGPWVGSPCDTLLSSSSPAQGEKPEVRINPNPAGSYFYVNYKIETGTSAQFVLYDAWGHTVSRHALYGHFKSLMVRTESLSNGIYFYRVVMQHETIGSGKVVIIH